MPTNREFRYDLRPQFQPLLYICVAFGAGAYIGQGQQWSPSAWSCVAGVSALLALVTWILLRSASWTIVTVSIVATCLGGARAAQVEEAAQAVPLRRLVECHAIAAGGNLILEGSVSGTIARFGQRSRVALDVEALTTARGEVYSGSSIGRAYLLLADGKGSLSHGMRIRASGRVIDDLAFRDPGLETARERARRVGVDVTIRVADAGVLVLGNSDRSIAGTLFTLRERGLESLSRGFDSETAGVLRALLLGDVSLLDSELAEDYRVSGVFHVLVVSGAHVALIAALLLIPVSRITRSTWARLACAAIPVWAYTAALGMSAPAVRAAIALTFGLAAPFFWRRATPANTVAGAALACMAWSPDSLFDPSFQLTFAAVMAIVLLAAPLIASLRDIGTWEPRRGAPYPPRAWRRLSQAAAWLYWDPVDSVESRRGSSVRYRPDKPGLIRRLNRLRLRGALAYVANGLGATVAALLALAPLAIEHFHRLSPIALAASIPVEASLALALIGGFAYLALDQIFPAAADWLVPAIDACVRVSNTCAAVAARVADGSRTPSPVGLQSWLPYALEGCLVGLAFVLSTWRPIPGSLIHLTAPLTRRCLVAAGLGCMAIVCVLGLALPGRPDATGQLEVLFLDVGQGDCTFIRFPDGTTMLVDAGPGKNPRLSGSPVAFDPGERIVCESLLEMGVASLDYVVATHCDADHVGGFEAVLENLEVSNALTSSFNGERERTFNQLLKNHGVRVNTLSAGDVVNVGQARIEVLWPPAGEDLGGNSGSLVLRVAFGRRAILLTGDVEALAEQRLAATAGDLSADVLKVPHHGSRGASSAALLERVNAKWAVISAPRLSTYGHPHPEAVARLSASTAQVLHTGRDGAVRITTDGERLDVAWLARHGE